MPRLFLSRISKLRMETPGQAHQRCGCEVFASTEEQEMARLWGEHAPALLGEAASLCAACAAAAAFGGFDDTGSTRSKAARRTMKAAAAAARDASISSRPSCHRCTSIMQDQKEAVLVLFLLPCTVCVLHLPN